MRISGREIGNGELPYVVAELSCSHSGSLDKALDLVRAAKDAGADAVKFQALTADGITIWADQPEFRIEDGPWQGRRLFDLYVEAQTPMEWWAPIMTEAACLGITCFPSVFDVRSISYLEALGCPAYKVSSFELTDTPLIEALAKTGKPLVMSTGMASGPEISAAIKAAYGTEFALLHCVSSYPTNYVHLNLHRIREMRRVYGCPVGFSDHSLGSMGAVVATAMGACIIEKHLMLSIGEYDGMLPLDNDFSLEPDEFRDMVKQIKHATLCLMGDEWPHPPRDEQAHRTLRRSLFAVDDIASGEILTEDNVRSIRPGHGLPPSMLPEVLGRKALVPIARGTPLSMEMLVHDTLASA